MNYELKLYDQTLIRFSAYDGAYPDVQILWADESHADLFPPDLTKPSAEGIESWVRRRLIPKNRAYADTLISSLGLSLNRPFHILKVSKGLSLNDCYWVTEEGFKGTFAEFNLFENRFNRLLGRIALTGYGTAEGVRITSSPEFTTNGMLPKCWRRENGVIKLYKGGTAGASNTGNEPYSEFLAYQIAEKMGINAIPYGLSKWKGTLCSTCELFTSKETSFVPVGRIVTRGGMPAVRKFYESLGSEYTATLNDMIVFDALILNTDRHFGNFGFLVDSRTNKIKAPAPLFDHGNSLLNYATSEALSGRKSILKYADAMLPCTYDSFIDEAKSYMTHEHRNHLRSMLDFRFRKHNRYNPDPQRTALIEEAVHAQVSKLFG